MARFPSLPDGATVLDVFRLSPDLTRPLLDYHELLLRGPSPLSEAERELIAAYVSGLNGCDFCHGAHAATAEALGMPVGLVGELLRDPDAAPVDERMRPILAYVRKLTEAPASVTDADAQAVFEAGWSELALHHAVHVCALFNFMNRLVEGHGIEGLPEPMRTGLGRQLASGGYRQF